MNSPSWNCGRVGRWLAIALLALAWSGSGNSAWAEPRRSEAHQAYADTLWQFVQKTLAGYDKWPRTEEPVAFAFGPIPSQVRCYVHGTAAGNPDAMPPGAIVIHEHRDGADAVAGITVFLRTKAGKGYDKLGDWYWAHYRPDGQVVKTVADQAPFDKRSFIANVHDGRLWVLPVNSPALDEFLKTGAVERHIIRPGAGPDGMTIKAPDAASLDAYLAP